MPELEVMGPCERRTEVSLSAVVFLKVRSWVLSWERREGAWGGVGVEVGGSAGLLFLGPVLAPPALEGRMWT